MGFGDIISHIGDAVAGTVDAVGTFGKEQVAPAVAEAGNAIAPAIAEAGGAIASTASTIETFGKENLVPAVQEAGTAIASTASTLNDQLAPAIADAGTAIQVFGNDTILPAIEVVSAWTGEHPVQAALIAGSALTFAAPGIVTGPLLWIFGIGGTGVRAGTAAAAVQSSIGNVVAGSVFATAQSAGMGGYGIVIVNAVARVGAVFIGGLGGLLGASGVEEEVVDVGGE